MSTVKYLKRFRLENRDKTVSWIVNKVNHILELWGPELT